MVVETIQFIRMIRDKKIRKEDEIWARHIRTKSVTKIKDKGTLDFNTDMTYPDVIEYEFEILSEDKEQEIDIQSIEDLAIRPYLGISSVYEDIENKINELIKALKQLDKKIK